MAVSSPGVPVAGWLARPDELLFEWILTWQSRNGVRGDVVELGVYQGRSAIHIGRFVEDGERFIVCDLFEDIRASESVPSGIRQSYSTLTQQGFEANYLRVHPSLPTIVRGHTSRITEHVAPASCRFVHIDASHLYDDVRADTAAAQTMLGTGGVVAFDDYRNEKTLGTAAALWEAVAVDGLTPICVSSAKLYATWGDPEPLQRHITKRLDRDGSYSADRVALRCGSVIRLATTALPPAAYGRPTKTADVADSRAARTLDSAGRAMSSLGYRLSRLARADQPLDAMRRAASRRFARLQGLVDDVRRRR